MEQSSKEKSSWVSSIIEAIIKCIVYFALIMIMLEGVSRAYDFGNAVVNPKAMESEPGTIKTVTISEADTNESVARILSTLGLIESEWVFYVQQIFYEYEINPGNYQLSTSMNSKEILSIINQGQESGEDSES